MTRHYRRRTTKRRVRAFVYEVLGIILLLAIGISLNPTITIGILFAIPIVYATYRFIRWNDKRRKVLRYESLLRNPEYAQVDYMPGAVFEDFLKTLFEDFGYEVEKVGQKGDYGADLILTYQVPHVQSGQLHKIRIIVQAKRWNSKVNLKAVQEICAAKARYRAPLAAVVTNNFFENSAINLAYDNQVYLIDRARLFALLEARWGRIAVPQLFLPGLPENLPAKTSDRFPKAI